LTDRLTVYFLIRKSSGGGGVDSS